MSITPADHEQEDAGGTSVPPALSAAHEADVLLVATLRAEGFGGPRWARVEEALAQYGLAVLSSWVRSEEVYGQLARIGRPVSYSAADANVLRQAPEELDSMVMETVATALFSFQRRLEQGEWDPCLGASLSTYFVRGMLYEFSGVFRRWQRSQRLRERELPVSDLIEPHFQAVSAEDPSDTVAGNIEVKDTLDRLSTQDRMIVQLRMDGYSTAEVAEMMNLTTRAVEGRLYRLRKRLAGPLERRTAPSDALSAP